MENIIIKSMLNTECMSLHQKLNMNSPQNKWFRFTLKHIPMYLEIFQNCWFVSMIMCGFHIWTDNLAKKTSKLGEKIIKGNF